MRRPDLKGFWLPYLAMCSLVALAFAPWRFDERLLVFWLPHVLGIDTQQSWFYDFWSGVAASGAAWLAIAFAWYSLRIELQALKLETRLMQLELEKQRGGVTDPVRDGADRVRDELAG